MQSKLYDSKSFDKDDEKQLAQLLGYSCIEEAQLKAVIMNQTEQQTISDTFKKQCIDELGTPLRLDLFYN